MPMWRPEVNSGYGFSGTVYLIITVVVVIKNRVYHWPGACQLDYTG